MYFKSGTDSVTFTKVAESVVGNSPNFCDFLENLKITNNATLKVPLIMLLLYSRKSGTVKLHHHILSWPR